MILGIDASTTTAGYAFCENGIIKSAGFIDLTKFELNKDKSFFIINELIKNPCLTTTTTINLEAPLSGFVVGFTSQQTIVKLIRFNAILEYVLDEELKIPINLVNVSTARKKVFGKARLKGVKSKDYVKMMIPSIVPNYLEFNILNKIKNVDKRMEDTWDAMVMSLY